MALGLLALALGAAVYLGLFSWFGRLPGDIRAGSGNVRFYFPLTSMLLLSLALSALLNLIRRLF
jgi:hypothetical protein